MNLLIKLLNIIFLIIFLQIVTGCSEFSVFSDFWGEKSLNRTDYEKKISSQKEELRNELKKIHQQNFNSPINIYLEGETVLSEGLRLTVNPGWIGVHDTEEDEIHLNSNNIKGALVSVLNVKPKTEKARKEFCTITVNDFYNMEIDFIEPPSLSKTNTSKICKWDFINRKDGSFNYYYAEYFDTDRIVDIFVTVYGRIDQKTLISQALSNTLLPELQKAVKHSLGEFDKNEQMKIIGYYK